MSWDLKAIDYKIFFLQSPNPDEAEIKQPWNEL